MARISKLPGGRSPLRTLPRWTAGAAILALSAASALPTKMQFDTLIESKQQPEVAGNQVEGETPPEIDGPVIIDKTSPLPTIDPALRTESARPAGDPWVNPTSSETPWSDQGKQEGLLTFRGNPTRSYHGTGTIPQSPQILWEKSIGCSQSAVANEPKEWCGTGWTGQPSVFRPPGQTQGWWVGVGGYNRAVNFFDSKTGESVFGNYETDDIIKGSISIDPDGFPLMYTGSRDGFFHIVALDTEEPTALWKLSADAVQPTLWNDDWDSSALILDDYLFVGGENSRFFIIKLNRAFQNEKVVVNPEIVFSAESWDDELLEAVGDDQMSVENSIAVSGDTVYFANSAGLVQGWNIKGLEDGEEPERTFRFWTGDDTDASIVIDEAGMLYVGSQYERGTNRSKGLGQAFKLDPSKPNNSLMWSVQANTGLGSGIWATPALYQDLVIFPTNDGRVLGLDKASGQQRWVLELPGPLWSSPVVVNGVLLQGDCSGNLNAFDISDTSRPPVPLWDLQLTGCIESTPAVWGETIFVGTRGGSFYAIND